MTARYAGALLVIFTAGCTAPMSKLGLGPKPGAALLVRADEQMAAANYRGARDLYAEFLTAYPSHAAVSRARAAQETIDRLLAAQTEIERLRRAVETRDAELERARRELAATRVKPDQPPAKATAPPLRAAEGDVGRLQRDLGDRQAEVDRLRSEVAKLRADLERLRRIDLRPEPRRP
jgi:predicted RNase H-like nuclease (RuvC/YqgF family)